MAVVILIGLVLYQISFQTSPVVWIAAAAAAAAVAVAVAAAVAVVAGSGYLCQHTGGLLQVQMEELDPGVNVIKLFFLCQWTLAQVRLG